MYNKSSFIKKKYRVVIPLNSSDDETDVSNQITTEERVLRFCLTVLIPLVVTFIAFGVIMLAYSQWKLY